jgi:hypothetical protein
MRRHRAHHALARRSQVTIYIRGGKESVVQTWCNATRTGIGIRVVHPLSSPSSNLSQDAQKWLFPGAKLVEENETKKLQMQTAAGKEIAVPVGRTLAPHPDHPGLPKKLRGEKSTRDIGLIELAYTLVNLDDPKQDEEELEAASPLKERS